MYVLRKKSMSPPIGVEGAHRLGDLLMATASRLPWSTTCLHRSLVLVWILRRYSLTPVLRLGVRRENNELKFHAWTEVSGQVVGDARDVAARYWAFANDSLPPTARFD